MFTYSGWNAAAYVAEEIRDPDRNVPLALGVGTLAVIGIYLLLNILYLYAMPLADLSAARRPAHRYRGRAAVRVRRRQRPGRVHHRQHRRRASARWCGRAPASTTRWPATACSCVPRRASTRGIGRRCSRSSAQAVWSSVLVLSGTLSQLVEYTGFAVVLFAAVAVMSVFVLRFREPDAPRPFRAWGYPLAPGFFVFASALMVRVSAVEQPGDVDVGPGRDSRRLPDLLAVRDGRASGRSVLRRSADAGESSADRCVGADVDDAHDESPDAGLSLDYGEFSMAISRNS